MTVQRLEDALTLRQPSQGQSDAMSAGVQPIAVPKTFGW